MIQFNQKALVYAFLLIFNGFFFTTSNAQVQQIYSFGELQSSIVNETSISGPIGCGTTMTVTIAPSSGTTAFEMNDHTFNSLDACAGNLNANSKGIRILPAGTSETMVEVDYTITFVPAINNFEFFVHGLEDRYGEDLSNFSVTINGITTTISDGNGLELITAESTNLGISTSTISPNIDSTGCGLIKIDKQNISSLTFRSNRNYKRAGHQLSEFRFEETGTAACCQTPTLCCSDEFMVPVIGSAGNDLGCSQIYDNGVGVGIGTTTPGSYSVSPGQTWLGVSPASFTGDFKLSVEGVTRSESYYSYSDRRFKKDIAPIENPLSLIRELNGVTYNWKNNKARGYEFSEIPQVGFIAQDLEKVIPEAVLIDEKGYYTVNYTTIIPVLTEALKEQDTKILALEEKISELEKLFTENNAEKLKGENVNKLFQNSPNPSANVTKIEYFLASDKDDAYILVYDMTGKQLESIALNQVDGFGMVEINAAQYAKGTYIYTLVVNGEVTATKKMVVTSAQN